MVRETSSGSSETADGIDNRRRQLIATLGGTAAIGLAGCSGDGGSTDTQGPGDDPTETPEPDETDDQETSQQEDTDRVFRWYNTAQDLTSGEMNHFSPRYDNSWTRVFYMRGYRPVTTHAEKTTEAMGYEEMNYDPDAGTYTIKLRDNIFWHQGSEIVDEFTSEDIRWNYEMQQVVSERSYPQIDEFTAPDDKTVVLEMADGVHTQELQYDEGPMQNHTGSWTYRNGEIVGKFKAWQDATSDSEKEELISEIINYEMPTDGTAITNGPWYVENASPQQLDLRRVPGHYLNEMTNWNRAQVSKVTASGNPFQQALRQGQIDWASGGLPSNRSLSQVADHISTKMLERQQGRGVLINYGNEVDDMLIVEQGETAEKPVAKIRQAVAYAIDAIDVEVNHLGERITEEAPKLDATHFGEGNLIDEFYPDLMEKLPRYGPEAKPEKAKEALRAAGLTEENGTWTKPNGETFSIEIQVRQSESELGVTVDSALKNIGLDSTSIAEDDTAFVEDLFQNGFSFCPCFVYTGLTPPEIESVNMLSSTGNTWAWAQHLPPGQYAIPEIGDMTGDTVETFNADEAESEILTSSMDEHPELGKKAIWTASYHLPAIPLFPGVESFRFNTDTFEWPGPDDKFYAVTEEHPIGAGINGEYAKRGLPGQRAKSE